MSRHAIAVLAAVPLIVCACASAPLTQAILVRHAEKERDAGPDPALTSVGQARARALAAVVARTSIAAVFASEFARTQATVAPVADLRHVPLEVAAADPDALAKKIRDGYRKQVVLVAAHSNTIPKVIASLGGPAIPDLDDDAYDDLFVLSWVGSEPARLLHLRYAVTGTPD